MGPVSHSIATDDAAASQGIQLWGAGVVGVPAGSAWLDFCGVADLGSFDWEGDLLSMLSTWFAGSQLGFPRLNRPSRSTSATSILMRRRDR